MCLERSFVKPLIEDFLVKRKKREKLVFGFHLGGGVPPPKLPRFNGYMYMCCCHLLEYLNSHICKKESGKMTINLQNKIL